MRTSILRNAGVGATIAVAALVAAVPSAAAQQTAPAPPPVDWPAADPADVATIDALIRASYETLIRAPGENFDRDRYRSLRLPGAITIPNSEQTGGAFAPRTVAEHVARSERAYAESEFIGSERDRGFTEDEIHRTVRRYGDVAHVESTYVKRLHASDELLGRGVNFYTLVWDGERWWITAAAWDEESGAGPLPAEYLS